VTVKLSPVSLAFLTLPLAAADRIDFDRQVHPILAERCVVCHSQEKRSGGLSLATLRDTLDGGRSGATIKPGSSATSLLYQRITGEAQPRMPLGGGPLNETQIAILRTWIDEGARATPTSAPAKPKWEAPLTLKTPADPNGSINHFLPTPTVISDAQFARRAYLDVWGLLPTPEQLHEFTANTDSKKRTQLVETLLANKRNYAEHWISYWNDLLRNDEGVNYISETASRKSITQWLLGALETNLPYNRFVEKLLNPTEPTDPEGFLVGVNWRGVVSASQTPAIQAAQNTAQIFLGINLKCNSCHDSFISHWKLKDAYSLASYFAPEPKLQLYRCDVAQDQYAEAAFLYPELYKAPASNSQADRRAAAAAAFLDPRDGRLARTLVNRIWERLLGKGIVENPDEMDGEPSNPELLDWLAADFVDHGYDMKRLIATIMESRAYQSPTAERRITAEEFADAVGAITGDWHVSNGHYTREWRMAASPLTKALGRPIRDQVYSVRDRQATTLQALELVNGETLTHWLARGAKKMQGQLPPDPVAIYDKPYNPKNGSQDVDIDISKADKLWLIVHDEGSYSPEKILAIWQSAELVGPDKSKPIGTTEGLRVKTPSVEVLDIKGQGYTRLRGKVAMENKEITSDLNPHIRFLVFQNEPNMERLTPVAPETPLPPGPVLKTPGEIVNRVFWYALGRAPSPAERTLALKAVSEGALADLLWAVLMKPEFQLI
jgi:hypothetical protein